MHLKEEQLIDLAEGTRPDSAEPHLASCERCRAELADLRAVMSVAASVDVPEPSPLFWDHLAVRVHDAVAAEAASAPGSDLLGLGRAPSLAVWGWRVVLPVAALAALVVAVAISVRSPSEVGSGGSPAGTAPIAGVDVAALVDLDPSLSLLADLAGELDWDDAVGAGLTTSSWSVDRVVFEMSAEERRELQRILKEELTKS